MRFETTCMEWHYRMEPVLRVDRGGLFYVRAFPFWITPEGFVPVESLEGRMDALVALAVKGHPFPVGLGLGEEADEEAARTLRMVLDMEGLPPAKVFVELSGREPRLLARAEGFLRWGFPVVVWDAEALCEADELPPSVYRVFGAGSLLDPEWERRIREAWFPFGVNGVASPFQLNEARRLGASFYAGPLALARMAV